MITRVALCGLLALLPCTAADLFPVAGTVINAIAKSPIPHAQIYFYRSGATPPANPYITGADGRFSFNVPAGTYVMRAGIRGSQEIYGSHHGDSALGSAIIVGPGKDSANIVFRFYPTASISGKVLDDEGEPVEDAIVQLIRSHVAGGRRVTQGFRSVRTDDRGEYRFGFIPGGTYYVTVTGEPWYTVTRYGTYIANDEQSVETRQAYAPSYYPDTSDAAHAAPLKIAPGEEVHADFTLRTVTGAKILVKHGAPAGSKGLISLLYDGIAGVDAFQQQVNLAGVGTQMLSGVPPGRYTLRVTENAGGSYLIGFAHVDVNGADVTVEVAMHPVASISGRLQFARTGVQPSETVIVVLTRDGTTSTYSATVKPDGGFRFPNVLPGKYHTAIRNSAGLFPAKIEVRGAALRDRLIDVGDGDSANVTITASDEAGSVSGVVKDRDRTVAEVLAVLAPASKDLPSSNHGFQTESDGSFKFTTIPAGKYLLFAVEDKEFEYANPEAVKPYLAGATPVTIEPHQTSEQNVGLTALKP